MSSVWFVFQDFNLSLLEQLQIDTKNGMYKTFTVNQAFNDISKRLRNTINGELSWTEVWSFEIDRVLKY